MVEKKDRDKNCRRLIYFFLGVHLLCKIADLLRNNTKCPSRARNGSCSFMRVVLQIAGIHPKCASPDQMRTEAFPMYCCTFVLVRGAKEYKSRQTLAKYWCITSTLKAVKTILLYIP